LAPVASPHDRHRHRRPPDHRFGDAAEQDLRDALPTVAAEDDVVAILLVGELDDGPGGFADSSVG
jgi:hypothetical protein